MSPLALLALFGRIPAVVVLFMPLPNLGPVRTAEGSGGGWDAGVRGGPAQTISPGRAGSLRVRPERENPRRGFLPPSPRLGGRMGRLSVTGGSNGTFIPDARWLIAPTKDGPTGRTVLDGMPLARTAGTVWAGSGLQGPGRAGVGAAVPAVVRAMPTKDILRAAMLNPTCPRGGGGPAGLTAGRRAGLGVPG